MVSRSSYPTQSPDTSDRSGARCSSNASASQYLSPSPGPAATCSQKGDERDYHQQLDQRKWPALFGGAFLPCPEARLLGPHSRANLRLGLDPEFQIFSVWPSSQLPKAVSAVCHFVVLFDFSVHNSFYSFLVLLDVGRRAPKLPMAARESAWPVLLLLRSCKRLGNVRFDVFHIFDADREPHIVRRDAGPGLL